VLCTCAAYHETGDRSALAFDTKSLEKLFPHKLLNMLSRKGKISEEAIKLILSWRHSDFNLHCGTRIQPGDEEAMENTARYIIRASFSHERMTCFTDISKVIYQSKDE
jgi:hypothetical protein